MTNNEFAGQSIVITGAAGGIGAATAERFAHDGAKVALLDINVEAARGLASQLPDAMALEVDVTNPSSCRAAIEQVSSEWGGVDVLVNNAGVTHISKFVDTEVDVLRRVMDINFWGSVYCTDAALPSLIERGGRIVVISSIAGFAPLVLRTGYSASKHALHGFFESLRSELVDTEVSVTMVCPFLVRTGIKDLVGTTGRTESGNIAEPAAIASEIFDATLARERLLLPSDESRAAYDLSRSDPAGFEEIMLATMTTD
ncbi:MAG: SDR family oxidoreductase [Acidimicrobiales bacterium]